jgi:hypothetical protein
MPAKRRLRSKNLRQLDEQVFNVLDEDFRGEKFPLMDSFVVFRCGKKVYERTYGGRLASYLW